MQVSPSSAYQRLSDRRARAVGEAGEAGGAQRFADMPGAKPMDTVAVPALSELRWIADELQVVMGVEGSRNNLKAAQHFRGLLNQSILNCSEYMNVAKSLIEKYGAQPRFLDMMDVAKAELRSLSMRTREKDLEIDGLATELDEKMRAPAYQQWLSRQAAQQDEAAGAQGAKALVDRV